MELKRIKPYKARKPEDTILLIRNLLHQKLGILLKEEHYVGDNKFYSCRINIANYDIDELNIGTNGKGMKLEYALASAYGEFMERLQNQILIMSRPLSDVYNGRHDFSSLSIINDDELKTKYIYAPDEVNIKYDKSMSYIRQYIRSCDIQQLEKLYDGKSLTLVPFVNVYEKKVELLPLNIIFSMCTSNGMCAGNTPKEALIQGMSEILERFVVRKIYYENISFPTVPFEKFNNAIIYQRIKDIQAKYRWEFYIKDCSCDIGIPAIGVLIIDRENMKYLFHIGVDPSPITALERTLTEIYQGRLTLSLKDIDIDLQHNLMYDENLKNDEMFKTCTTGHGQFPLTLLFGKPTYCFTDFDLTWGQSDESDFDKMVGLFKVLGTDLFIRDVSFLGFPAYYIYSPGLSEFRNIVSNHDLESVGELKKIYPISRNIEKANVNDIELLLNYIENNQNIAFGNLKFCNTKDIWNHYNKNLILALLNYTVLRYDSALKYMELFMSDSTLNNKEHRFFACILDIIKSKVKNYDIEWVKAIYGVNFVGLCVSFLNNKKYLNYLDHASCYDCDLCRIRKSCKAKSILTLVKKIENAYIENTPDQNNLLSILCK